MKRSANKQRGRSTARRRRWYKDMTLQDCHYCGNAGGTHDHIIPFALGGGFTRDNLVPACIPCQNDKKADFPDCDCLKCQTAISTWFKNNSLSLLAERFAS